MRYGARKIVINQGLHGMSPKDAVLDVLYDGGAEVSTLFRYCLASNMNTPAVYGEYMEGTRAAAAIAYYCVRTYSTKPGESGFPRTYAGTPRQCTESS